MTLTQNWLKFDQFMIDFSRRDFKHDFFMLTAAKVEWGPLTRHLYVDTPLPFSSSPG